MGTAHGLQKNKRILQGGRLLNQQAPFSVISHTKNQSFLLRHIRALWQI